MKPRTCIPPVNETIEATLGLVQSLLKALRGPNRQHNNGNGKRRKGKSKLIDLGDVECSIVASKALGSKAEGEKSSEI